MSRTRRRRAALDRRLGNNGTDRRWQRRLVRFEQTLYVRHPPVKHRFAHDGEKDTQVGQVHAGHASIDAEVSRQSCWARGEAWLGEVR